MQLLNSGVTCHEWGPLQLWPQNWMLPLRQAVG